MVAGLAGFELTLTGRIEASPEAPQYELQLPTQLFMNCLSCVHQQPWDIRFPHDGKADVGFCEVTYACRACRSAQYYWLFLRFDETGGTILKTAWQRHGAANGDGPALQCRRSARPFCRSRKRLSLRSASRLYLRGRTSPWDASTARRRPVLRGAHPAA